MTKISPPAAFGATALITAINVSVASGFALAGLIRPDMLLPEGAAPSRASLIFAAYAAARAIPLALAVFIAIYLRSVPALIVLGGVAGAIQLADAAIGVFLSDPGKTFGPAAIFLLQTFAVVALARASDGTRAAEAA